MKILLISPLRNVTQKTSKNLMMPQLALIIIEGLTPKEHEVKIIEEESQAVNIDEDCDLVGISCMTANANRAYHLAEEFRKRGKTVVLGGVHPTILPDEAMQYADSVVIGEAEGVWKQLLEDFQNKKLQKKYHVSKPDISTYIPKNFARLKKRKIFNIIPLMTTRGCPYSCDFCCVSSIFGKEIRHIPVENIVKDIKNSKSKQFIFLDDNIIGQPKYAKELFKAIKPLKIQWVGQSSVSFAKDAELMQLAADSGCRVLFIGLESVSEYQLKNTKKSYNDVAELETAIKKIKKMKILIHASMIFGFDSDTKSTFNDTLNFLIRNKINSVSFNVLTPYPGTKTFNEFKEDGRLLTNDWQYYDHNTVVFTPKNMSPIDLQIGKISTKRKFYSIPSVLKRFSGNLYDPLLYLFINVGHITQSKVELDRIPSFKSLLSGFENEMISKKKLVFEKEKVLVEVL
ncbi:MAG: radical SAM protein [Bacteroidales bacterium]|nr:radical SAM protein [Bacteroidales bacterium]